MCSELSLAASIADYFVLRGEARIGSRKTSNAKKSAARYRKHVSGIERRPKRRASRQFRSARLEKPQKESSPARVN